MAAGCGPLPGKDFVTVSCRDILTFTPLLISTGMAVAGSAFRASDPATPNYVFAAFGGLFGAISFVMGLHVVFFERRRPVRYPKAWQRFAVALVLWIGGCTAMAWNLSSAKPQ